MRTAHSRVAVAGILGLTLIGSAACSGSSKAAAPAPATSVPVTAPSTSTPAASATPTASPSPTSTTRGLTGVVDGVAGNGKEDGKGVPGPASAVSLGTATQFALAANGDIYLSNGALDVLKISNGQVSVFGHLDPQYGPGSRGIAVAPDGSIYVVTSNVVYRFTADGKHKIVLNAHSKGLPTSLGPILIDPAGKIYVGDGTPRLLLLAGTGKTTVIAGTKGQSPGDTAPGDNGPAVKAALGTLSQVTVDGHGNLLIADVKSHRIRQIAPDGTITTIAGGGTTQLLSNAQLYAPDGTSPTDLLLSQVTGVAVDATGRIYVADGGDQAIFRFTPGSGIELVAADQRGTSETGGLPAAQTRVTNVGALAFNAQGDLFYYQSGVIYRLAGAAA